MGAEKCLGDALALVGLTTEPMEGKGVALIATGKGISRFFGSDASHEVTNLIGPWCDESDWPLM